MRASVLSLDRLKVGHGAADRVVPAVEVVVVRDGRARRGRRGNTQVQTVPVVLQSGRAARQATQGIDRLTHAGTFEFGHRGTHARDVHDLGGITHDLHVGRDLIERLRGFLDLLDLVVDHVHVLGQILDVIERSGDVRLRVVNDVLGAGEGSRSQ